jgi:hypothetical protein
MKGDTLAGGCSPRPRKEISPIIQIESLLHEYVKLLSKEENGRGCEKLRFSRSTLLVGPHPLSDSGSSSVWS